VSYFAATGDAAGVGSLMPQNLSLQVKTQ